MLTERLGAVSGTTQPCGAARADFEPQRPDLGHVHSASSFDTLGRRPSATWRHRAAPESEMDRRSGLPSDAMKSKPLSLTRYSRPAQSTR